MPATCYECALRGCGLFKPITPEELSIINDILQERVSRPAGAKIVRAGDDSPELYTLIAAGRSASRCWPMAAGRS
jgi:hypothetical protein